MINMYSKMARGPLMVYAVWVLCWVLSSGSSGFKIGFSQTQISAVNFLSSTTTLLTAFFPPFFLCLWCFSSNLVKSQLFIFITTLLFIIVCWSESEAVTKCFSFLAAFKKQQIQDLQVEVWFHWQLPVLLWGKVQWHWFDDRRGDLQAAAECRYWFWKYKRFSHGGNSKRDDRAVMKWIMHSVWIGIDKLLAQHIAHLFIRDPLSVFEEKIHLDDENESDHFEVRI